MTRASALALAVLAAALAVLALADDARAATLDITISGSLFQPQSVEVAEGDVVRWNNNDGVAHTARSSGNWDTGVIDPSGGSASITMTRTGTFSYACAIHSGMSGTVRVSAASQNAPPAVAISSPRANDVISGVTSIVVAAADPDNDAVTVALRIDNGDFRAVTRSSAGFVYTWDTRNTTNGGHTLTARASDARATTTSSTITLIVNNPPTITLATPAHGSNATLGHVVAVTGTTTAPYGSTITVEVSVDGGEWAAVSGRTFWSYAWNTSGLEPGEHIVEARVRDELNSVLSLPHTVTLIEPPPDLPPLLTIVSPAEGAAVAGLVNVSGEASDPDGSTPFVEFSLDGASWRNATGRAGTSWWFHWLPREDVSPAALHVRATSDGAIVALSRQVVLSGAPPPLTIELASTREAAPIVLRVLAANGSAEPLARVVLANATGAPVGEAQTNATGHAVFPALRPGEYEARAYAPGATSRTRFEVRSLYDVAVTPRVVDFERPVPIVVTVTADTAVRNLPVHLEGAPLPGGASDVVRTGRNGQAIVSLQALTAGEVAVFVAGNDTGVRVVVTPTVLVTWTPASPAANERVTARFTLNDVAHTPLAARAITIDIPGGGRQLLVTDADGALSLRPTTSGTLRATVARDGAPDVVHTLGVRATPAKPELSNLVARPGPASLSVSVTVKNAGSAPASFVIDAIATSEAAAVQGSATTLELPPAQEERVTILLRAGPGAYDLLVAVRNSSAAVTGAAQVVDAGVPPALTPSHDAPLAAPAREEDKKESPGATLGALVALAAVACVRRRG